MIETLTQGRCGIHLAVFSEPFLDHILSGKKTLESRFSRFSRAPFEEVATGDVIALKRTGGPVVGVCRAGRTWFLRLDSQDEVKRLRCEFGAALCAIQDSFWNERAEAKFVTLIEIADVVSVPPMSCGKRDRRGWVAIRQKDREARRCRKTQLSLWPEELDLESPP